MSTDRSPLRYGGRPSLDTRSDSTSLADLLERILDKGIVIAGDISISLVDIELLTIKLRLLIASVDKAREIGVNWWESDPWLTGRREQQRGGLQQGQLQEGQLQEGQLQEGGSGRAELESRLDRIETALAELAASRGGGRE